MRSLSALFFATALVSAVVSSTAHFAKSAEKGCQSPAVESTPVVSQPTAPAQTCCQPIAASVQPKIELVAYTRPTTPRRLTPRPDALDIQKTNADMACAWFLAADFGSFQVYYGLRCSDQYPLPIYANNLNPLPGDCGNPNGACVSIGDSVIPTAFNNKFSSDNGSVILKGVHLTQKLKAGQERPNRADAQASGAHKLKERSRVGEPIYIRFPESAGGSGFIVVELQKYSVKGTGKASQELSGTFAIGAEVDAVPAGAKSKEIDRTQIQVINDHVARLTIGNTTYDIVTATKLAP